MSSIEPFNRLVKLAARAFYDDITTKGENQPKTGRSDNRGIAVVVLDALTRRQWVREEDLAKDLKLHTKQLRRTLRFFEEEKFITRDNRKETAKGAKIYNAAFAATGDGQQTGREGDDKQKMHTHSYCCLDYAQIYDVVRYRLHRMKKKLKDELESKNTVQEYICPNCSKRYTALDALRLISPYDEYFHCESCNGVLVAESDKLAAQELGDGDDNVRRRRHEKIRDMLSKMETGLSTDCDHLMDMFGCCICYFGHILLQYAYVLTDWQYMDLMLPIALLRMVQLKPLTDQLARVKDLPVPEFGGLQAWEARANAAGRSANGELDGNDPSKSSQGFGFGGTPMPYVGETKVEVAFSGIDEKGENVTSQSASIPMKVLPPWMIKEGMNLTKEQRGDTKAEIKTGGTLTVAEVSEDKKSTTADIEGKNIQDEYLKAYYAALLLRQREQEETMKIQELANITFSDEIYETTPERQVGMKSKREEDYEGDGVEWEEAPTTGSKAKQFKVDLNEEAEASEDEDDDIDWEEG